MIRSTLRYLALSLCLALAVYVVAKHRNLIPDNIWRPSGTLRITIAQRLVFLERILVRVQKSNVSSFRH